MKCKECGGEIDKRGVMINVCASMLDFFYCCVDCGLCHWKLGGVYKYDYCGKKYNVYFVDLEKSKGRFRILLLQR